MKKNVAIYARTAGADSTEQLQGQMRSLRDYSKKRIGVEPAEFFDENIAGMTADRPGLQ